MLKSMLSMRDRMKDRVGIYSAGFNPESVIGLLLPFIVVGLLAVMAYALVQVLNP
jgi:hypothetical protein